MINTCIYTYYAVDQYFLSVHGWRNMTDAPDLDRFEPPEYLLAKLNTQIREFMHFALRPHGLKLVEWRVLQCLLNEDQVHTVADLAELAVIERTATSRLIDKMAARGLLKKEALENDRRFMRITITEAGRSAYAAADAAARAARRHLFGGMSDDDVTQLLRILRQMQSNSERPQQLAQIRPIRASGG